MSVSVALCTYNGGEFLEAQVESILRQSQPVDELIICDDHSSDNTIRIIDGLSRKYPDTIRLYQNQETLGARRNFEKALALCSGEIIFLADQDDVWTETKVAEMVSFFNSHPACEGVFSNGSLIGIDSSPLPGTLLDHTFLKSDLRKDVSSKDLLYWSIVLGNIATGATMAIRKTTLSFLLPFQLKMGKYLWHDAWIAFVLLSRGKLEYLDKCLIQYRLHHKQQVGIAVDQDPYEALIVSEREPTDNPATRKKIYLKYLDAFLFLKKFSRIHAVDHQVQQRVSERYQPAKKKFFYSLPFFKRKAVLLKWYFQRINNISVMDVVSL